MERPLKLKWDKYFILTRLSLSHGLKNVRSLMGLSLFLIACLIIFSHLWKIVAVKAGGVHFNPDQLLWYITFNEWVLISLPDVHMDMEHDLRSGRLAYLLPRPISYVGSKLAEGMGTLFLNLTVLGIVGFVFSWFWMGTIPFSFPMLSLSILLGYFAGAVAVIFQVLIGLSAFWLQEVSPINWIWEKLLFVFGGLILPLTTYPLWMQKVADWTPFPAILGGRSALALDPSLHHIISVISSLFLWAFIGITLILVTYRRGLRILNIEGG